jgi:nitroreductase
VADVPPISDLARVIARRRMTRSFAERPIDAGLLGSLLDLARRAPSAGFSQGTHFLVLEGSSLDEFWSLTGARDWWSTRHPGVLRAPVVVVPLADPDAYTQRYGEVDKAGHGLEDPDNWPVPFWLTDTAMATQNLLLLADSHGLGALYFGIFRNADAFLASRGVPVAVRAVGAVALGYRADDDRPTGSSEARERRPAATVIHRHRW